MSLEAHWKLLQILRDTPGTKRLVEIVVSVPIGRHKIQFNRQRALEKVRDATLRDESVSKLAPAVARIAAGDQGDFDVLHWAALHFLDGLMEEPPHPVKRIEKHSDPHSAATLAEGLLRFAADGKLEIGIEDLGSAKARSATYSAEAVLAAGIHRALVSGREHELESSPLIAAVVALRQQWRDGGDMKRWALNRLSIDVAAGSEALVAYWIAVLDGGGDTLDGIYQLTEDHAELAAEASVRILVARPNMPHAALISAIRVVAMHAADRLAGLVATERELESLCQAAIDTWTLLAAALDPGLLGTFADHVLLQVLSGADEELAKVLQRYSPDPIALDLARVRVIGAVSMPDPKDYRKSESRSGEVREAIKRVGASPQPAAGAGLRALLGSYGLSAWEWELRHALSQHLDLRRDREFVPPTVAQINSAMSGGPPTSPQDLQSVVMSELRRYQSTLRTGQFMPWKTFWNTNQHGKVTTPRIENECRDRLFELINLRLQPYVIAGDMPEARRGENTRVDMLLVGHSGMNLPIEAKRAHNAELWEAPATQLSGYAEDEHAHGFGVYLIIWFGPRFKTPIRHDGAAAATTAEELQAMLYEDLPKGLRGRFEMVVLDASPPEGWEPPNKENDQTDPDA